jgi:hypothetical protein
MAGDSVHRFEREITVSVIICAGCGASIAKNQNEAIGAWQQRVKTDQLLNAALPILLAHQEVELAREISEHLPKGGLQ